ncbi:hypothetical protein KIM67_00745 [Flagellimonas sp. 389]|nr:hypothetical protein [Flagellimonas sp. 389]
MKMYGKLSNRNFSWSEVIKVLTWSSAPLLIASLSVLMIILLGRAIFYLGQLTAPSVMFQMIAGFMLFGITPLYVWNTILINRGLRKTKSASRNQYIVYLLISLLPLISVSYLLVRIFMKD